jgi:hypothetical protein
MIFGRSPSPCVDELARGSISQHMATCERSRGEDRRDREAAAAEVARKLEAQNELTRTMHEQNRASVMKLMLLLIATLLTTIGAMAMEVVKSYHG